MKDRLLLLGYLAAVIADLAPSFDVIIVDEGSGLPPQGAQHSELMATRVAVRDLRRSDEASFHEFTSQLQTVTNHTIEIVHNYA